MEAPRKCRFAQILCRPLRSISPLRGHFRLGENPGDSAGMALSVNDFATFVLHSGRVKKYHRTHKGGDGPDTALGSSVWRSLVFSPPTWSILPGK